MSTGSESDMIANNSDKKYFLQHVKKDTACYDS